MQHTVDPSVVQPSVLVFGLHQPFQMPRLVKEKYVLVMIYYCYEINAIKYKNRRGEEKAMHFWTIVFYWLWKYFLPTTH